MSHPDLPDSDVRGLARSRSLRRAILSALTGAVLVFGVAACGSDDKTSSDSGTSSNAAGETASGGGEGVAEAAAAVKEAEATISQWKAPGPNYDASKAKGKSVWFITQQQSIPYNQAVIDGFEQGAEAAGVDATIANGKGQVANYGRIVSQAIDQNADAIVIHGIPSSLVAPQLERAGEAGIPVVTANTHDPGPPADDEPDAVVAEATHSFSGAGTLMADFMIADSDGKANGVIFTSSDVGLISSQEAEAIQKETERLCPDCKLEVIDVPIAQWGAMTARVPSILRENPDIDYLLPLFDGLAPLIVPGVRQAGAQDRVKIVTFNGSKAVLEMLAKGDVVRADVGQPATYEGWGTFDQVLRVMSGVDPVDDILVPLRLFTPNNIGDIDLEGDEGAWYLDFDYTEKYREMWQGS
jgi:ribose transport system substrate-binding protein